jgi:2-C-methyl-D-erythritol 4-phosphate cytidylyltransferase
MGRTTAIVVAAAAGERFGEEVAKPSLELAGQPLLLYSVRTLHDCEAIASVVLVVGPTHALRVRRLLDDRGLADVDVCVGGQTRRQSVTAGLARCPPDTEVVAVHDAARPLLGAALVERLLASFTPPWDAVAPVLPVVETVKLLEPDRSTVLRTVDRRGLWVVQTPQVLARSTLERMHRHTGGGAGYETDELSLVERVGGRVRLVDGDPRNFKITGSAHIRIAEALLAAAARPGVSEGGP